jgi:uncharacterized protein
MTDFSQIHRSPLLSFLFPPRHHSTPCPKGAFDLAVPLDKDVFISCRFYAGDKKWPWILYFHGNGEVVSDYDEIAPFYHEKGLNLVVADYRGYGTSGGSPNFTTLVHDAPLILKGVGEEMAGRGFPRSLWVMGRSLGSISAFELGYHSPEPIQGPINGLIIESGFASVTRLIQHLGVPTGGLDLGPIEQERLALIRKISLPALIIHGEGDTLVPLQEAKDVYAYLGSKEKELVVIPGADHNSVMFTDLRTYMGAIQKFVEKTK